MMKAFTPQQWDKFGRHVQPGCHCHNLYQGYEDILLENWPYHHTEHWIEIAARIRDAQRALQDRDRHDYLRYQPFRRAVTLNGPLPFMRFLINGKWYGPYLILALPDKA